MSFFAISVKWRTSRRIDTIWTGTSRRICVPHRICSVSSPDSWCITCERMSKIFRDVFPTDFRETENRIIDTIRSMSCTSIKLSRSALWLCWLTATAAGIASMFSIVAFVGAERSVWLRAAYAGLHRLGWSYATGWIVFACALDFAGPIRSVLSSRALVPLSRLTYCAYLMNGLVELYQASSIRTPKYMSTINMVMH